MKRTSVWIIRSWTGLSSLCGLAFVATLLVEPMQLAATPAPVLFGTTTVQAAFPVGILLRARVQSSAGPIIAAALECQAQGNMAPYRFDVPVTPSSQVELSYQWDPRPQGLPPGAIVACHWQARDNQDNVSSSEDATFGYEDTRFSWQVQQDGEIEVWWHDEPESLGREALTIARQAMAREQPFFQADLPKRARIMLYDSHDEISAWEPDLPAFVAGQAFPSAGVAVVTIQPPGIEEIWLHTAIPHELSRLYFYSAAYNQASPAPEWLAEGLALYNERSSHPDEQRLLQAAALGHQLLPLSSLTGDFGNDAVRVALGEAEAWSAATYLVQQYGAGAVLALLHAYRSGQGTPRAFSSAIGKTPGAFENDWLAWLGVPLTWRATANASAAPVPGAATQPATATAVPYAATSPVITDTQAEVYRVKRLPSDSPSARSPNESNMQTGGPGLFSLAPIAIAAFGLALLLAVAVTLAPRISARRRQRTGRG